MPYGMCGAISALTSSAMACAMATGAVLSAPSLMTPCASKVPTVTITVSMRAGTSFLNSIQFRSFMSRVGGFCAIAVAGPANVPNTIASVRVRMRRILSYAETVRIETERLVLVPITLPMVEAVFANDRVRAEALAGARLPEAWPGKALVERAFSADLELIRADPAQRLWGDRLMISHRNEREPRIVGSVIFHGRPD